VRFAERRETVALIRAACRPCQCRHFQHDRGQDRFGFGQKLRHIIVVTAIVRLAEQGDGFPSAEHQVVGNGGLLLVGILCLAPGALGTPWSHLPSAPVSDASPIAFESKAALSPMLT
jgi:hypothetical protein